jgi:hypothetical protein
VAEKVVQLFRPGWSQIGRLAKENRFPVQLFPEKEEGPTGEPSKPRESGELVAGACNHPNCLVLPFSVELIRLAA